MRESHFKLLYLIFLVLFTQMIPSFAQADVQSIYGTDSRQDLFEVTHPEYVKWAESTVALMTADMVRHNSSGRIDFLSTPLNKQVKLCPGERFSDQPVTPFCSGSLIARNLVLTAGHCVYDQAACEAIKFVFDYGIKDKEKYPTSTDESHVFGCKTLLFKTPLDETSDSNVDYALIELDRDVTDRTPLKLASNRTKTRIANGTPLVLIGNPLGLPTKIDAGKSVRDNSGKGFFIANVDSFGGNSGSPVLNLKSGEIEGVLVSGEEDFEKTNAGCFVSKVCTEDGCIGETVTKVANILNQLPKLGLSL